MAESTLSFDYARFCREAGREIGYGRDPALWIGVNAYKLVDVTDSLSAGLIRFYGEHRWEFLKPVIEIPLYAAYTTGTVTIVAGVVTLAGGTFPTWAAQGDLIVDGTTYSIASRDGDTQVTLTDTTIAAAAGSTYSLVQNTYELPEEFDGFTSQYLSYRPANDASIARVKLISSDDLTSYRIADGAIDRPVRASVVPRIRGSGAIGDRFDLWLWPGSSGAGRLIGRYRIKPNMLTGSAALTYPYGGPMHGPTIDAICKHEACRRFKAGYDGSYLDEYLKVLLPKSIRRDAEAYAPKTLGFDLGAASACRDPESLEALGIYGVPEPFFHD